MDEKNLQTNQANITDKRLEIDKEIYEKKKRAEEEIAARKKELDKKISEHWEEMDRQHQERLRIMNRQLSARELVAKLEAEFLAEEEQAEALADNLKTVSSEEVAKDVASVQSSGVDEATERVCGATGGNSFALPDEGAVDNKLVEEEPVAEQEQPKENGVVKLVKSIFHKETPQEIAEDIAKKEEERLAKEKEEEARLLQLEQQEKRRVSEMVAKEGGLRKEAERRAREKEAKKAEELAKQERAERERLKVREMERRQKEEEEQRRLQREKKGEQKKQAGDVSADDQEDSPDGVGEEMRKKNGGSLWTRVVLFLTAAILVALALFYGTVFVMKNIINATDVGIVYPRTRISNDSGEVIESVPSERINVLVMGTDYGDSEAGKDEPKRTDTMLLLSVDTKKDNVAVLSIPRDTRVVLSGHVDPQKINAAYAFGGVMLAKQTVANLLGVPITHYALAEWEAFTKIVDIIGGVDILVEQDMKYDDPYADLHINIRKGYRHLDGILAGQYVRYRSDELGDIGRTQRQQLFVRSAAKQMFKVENIVKIPTIIKTIIDNVETDMNLVTMFKVAKSVKGFGETNMKTCTLAGENYDSDGVSYWLTDDDAIRRSLKEMEIPSSKVK